MDMSERITGHVDLTKRYPVVRVPQPFVDRLLADGVGHMTVRIDDAERCMVIRPVDVSDVEEKEAT